MGIKLDWEVESEGGWDEVGEDPKTIEARRRRARRIRNVVLALLAAVLVVGGIIAYRLYTVGRQVREALSATVAAETLALRIGDRGSYLVAQSDLGGWRQIQEQTFQQYQAEGAQVDATGQIVQMDISADQARVTLREVVDGNAYNVMWFYQRNAGGWKHIAPDPHFWGAQQERHSTYVSFDYYSEDQALVDALGPQLNSWWSSACDLTPCVYKPAPIDVKIEPDRLARVGWAQYDANALIIPSPLLGRYLADGKPDPLLISQLADLIANRWAESQVSGEGQPYSDVQWLRSEVHWWLRHSFDPAQPPAPLLDPLVQAYSTQIVLPLIMRIERGDPVVTVLQEQTGANAADLPVGWELYLTYRLRAEMSLIREGKETEAILLYRDPERPLADAAITSSMGQSNIDTIQVIGLRRYGDLVWAETTFSGVAPADGRGTANDTMTIFVPFRLLSDRWVRTVAAEPDWGPARGDRGAHVIVRYHDLDAPAIAGLQTALEQAFNRVTTDMGDVVTAPVLVEIVGYDIQGNALPFEGPGLGEERSNSPEVTSVRVPSPYSTHHVSKGTVQESLRAAVVRDFITALMEQPLSINSSLMYAFQQWELSRLGASSVKFGDLSMGEYAQFCKLPESLEDLWLFDQYSVGCDNVAAKVLLAMLAERYGDGVVARLIPNLSLSSNMDDWLYRSLGIHATDIEGEWIERFRVALTIPPD